MASHTLSGLPIISYCNSQSCHRNATDTDSPSPSSSSFSTFLRRPKPHNLTTPFTGRKLSIRSLSSQRFLSKHRPAFATVLLSLPTLKPERASSDKTPKWSARAIKSFAMGKLEARKLKYPTTGTEALLMGILVEGTSIAAKFLRANGITLFKVREETVKFLGKSDMYYFSPEHPPLTEPAQRALDWAVDEKLKSGSFGTAATRKNQESDSALSTSSMCKSQKGEDGEITTSYLLLGIWSEKDSAGHKIMASLGFDDEKAKELAKSINEDFVLTHK